MPRCARHPYRRRRAIRRVGAATSEAATCILHRINVLRMIFGCNRRCRAQEVVYGCTSARASWPQAQHAVSRSSVQPQLSDSTAALWPSIICAPQVPRSGATSTRGLVRHIILPRSSGACTLRDRASQAQSWRRHVAVAKRAPIGSKVCGACEHRPCDGVDGGISCLSCSCRVCADVSGAVPDRWPLWRLCRGVT
jgi:hypothetical protein